MISNCNFNCTISSKTKNYELTGSSWKYLEFLTDSNKK